MHLYRYMSYADTTTTWRYNEFKWLTTSLTIAGDKVYSPPAPDLHPSAKADLMKDRNVPPFPFGKQLAQYRHEWK